MSWKTYILVTPTCLHAVMLELSTCDAKTIATAVFELFACPIYFTDINFDSFFCIVVSRYVVFLWMLP